MTLLQRCPDSTHKNKATDKEIEEWQKSLKRWILCVKRDGFELYMQDGTTLLQDRVPKRGPWSPRGQSISDLFWRSPETGDLRRNIGFAPVLSTGKKNSTARRFSNLSKNCWNVVTRRPSQWMPRPDTEQRILKNL